MKKLLSTLLALCLITALLAGCSGKDDPTQPTGESGGGEPAGETLKVGINYELSGAVATYGQGSVDGIEMAFEKINAAGGINGKMIEAVKYDNKSDAAEATTLTTRLMTQDKVLAVVGPATSGAFKATIPVANNNKIPVASGSATAEDVTGTFQLADDGSVVLGANGKPEGLHEYAFRICYYDSFQGSHMATLAKNTLGTSRAAVISEASDYGRGLASSFSATFAELGGTVAAEESYVEGDTDFNAILTRLKNLNVDVIFIGGYYGEAGLIIKQAREQGLDVPVLGADGFDSPDLVNLATAEHLNNVYFSNHYSSLSEDPVVVEFISEFKAKYGREPDAFNALGYDLGMFVADALRRATAETGEAVMQAMESTADFAGVTGRFSIDSQHNAVKDLVVIKLVDGVQAETVS